MPLFIDNYPPVTAAAIVVIDDKWAAPAAVAPPLARAAHTPAAQAVLVDARVAEGVAAMLADAAERDPPPNRQANLQRAAYGSETFAQFSKDFAQAKVPSCGGNDALKFQPPMIGPIAFGGLFAIPFAAVAALRGKCLMH